MYEYYSGEEDPHLPESSIQTREEADTFNAVECPNGCGFWRSDILDDGMCPECGDDTHNLPDGHFDEDND